MLFSPQLVIPRPKVTAAAGGGGGNDANTVLLLHCDGTNGSTTFTDSAVGGAAPHTITVGGDAQISTASPQFGTGACLLDGAGDYLLLDGSSDFSFGTGDFTIDFCLKTSGASGNIYDGRGGGATNGLALYLSSSHATLFVGGSNRINGTSNVSSGSWVHIALARASGTTKLFVGGTQEGSDYTDANNYDVGTSRPALGADGIALSGSFVSGRLDEFRISKGVARWTTNFTPPVAAYSP